MHKIAPYLAYCYAFKGVDYYMYALQEQIKINVEKNDFSLLDLAHHLSSGLKAFLTTKLVDGLDILRQSCGGAGFSAWSGLPQLCSDQTPKITYEGDNVIMATQGTRFIIKTVRNLKKGMKASGFFKYLNKLEKFKSFTCPAKSPECFLDLDLLEGALKIRATFTAKELLFDIFNSQASNKEIMNSLYGIDLLNLSDAHFSYVTFLIFRQKIKEAAFSCPQLNNAMNLVCAVLGIYELFKNN
mmetsp:Transcript_47447/g.34731  ORF Transcript_47447/g.34731 Transcript_47447/m.34731 type:complete len:242 (-) Transcript_47447:305-1030(-)